MTGKTSIPALALAAGLLTFALATPATAASDPSRNDAIELGVGWFLPDAPPLDDSIAARIGWSRRLNDRWSFAIGFTRASEIGIGAGLGTSRGFDFNLFDVGARWDAASWDGGRFQLAGGVGWRAISGSFGTVDDSPTVHLGLGLELDLGQRVYLRPAAKWRLVDELPDETADFEGTLSVGFRF